MNFKSIWRPLNTFSIPKVSKKNFPTRNVIASCSTVDQSLNAFHTLFGKMRGPSFATYTQSDSLSRLCKRENIFKELSLLKIMKTCVRSHTFAVRP